MARGNAKRMVVVRSERITPHMQRITFGGSDCSGFTGESSSAYMKLAFPEVLQKGASLKKRIRVMLKGEAHVVRSYTIRSVDTQKTEIDMDFVLHADHGVACTWARSAKPGDEMLFYGVGPKKLVDFSADWFLIVGDMSALPAIGANLEQMPETAKGYVIIEILDEQDKQSLRIPDGIQVNWIINPDPQRSGEVLLDAVREAQWLDGRVDVWVAGELNAIRAIRSYLKEQRNVGRDQMYASSYWQFGRTDEQHRTEKSRDKF